LAAANAVGFHSPLEAARILGAAINNAQPARLEITRVLVGREIADPVPLPDFSTKAKAQQYLGLQLEKLQQDKRDFLQKVVSERVKAAQERQAKLSE